MLKFVFMFDEWSFFYTAIFELYRNDSFVRISVYSIRLIKQFCTELQFQLSEHTLGSDNIWVTVLIISAPQTNAKTYKTKHVRQLQ